MEHAHDGHRARIREKLLTGGPESMPPHELVEYLLYHCMPRQNTNPLAHALLHRFGDLSGLFSADEAALAQVEGMTRQSAQWISMMGRCILTYIDSEDRSICLRNRRDARDYMIQLLACTGQTGCWLLCLNANGCITHSLPTPSPWHTPENLRRIVSYALSCMAHSILLVQSRSDYPLTKQEAELTAQLMQSLALINVTLIEHMTMDLTGRQVDYATNPLIYRLRDQPNTADEGTHLLMHWLDEV